MRNISARELRKMKKDIRKNPQSYKGNVKLLTSQVDNKNINTDKEIKRLRKKIAAY